MTFNVLYILLSTAIAVTDLIIALKASKKRNRTGRYLSLIGIFAAIADMSYLVSIFVSDYRGYSILESIYFASIDYMVLALAGCAAVITGWIGRKSSRVFFGVLSIYCAFDLIVFAINPFKEIAISYVFRDTPIAMYGYSMKPLYIMHLGYVYFIIGTTIIALIQRAIRVPREYKLQYWVIILVIVLIVGMNGIYLFTPGIEVYNLIDYSICGYSIAMFFIYWSCFEYTTNSMANRFKGYVFESIDRGIVLFDFEDKMILNNSVAERMLPAAEFSEDLKRDEFCSACGIESRADSAENSFSVQCYSKTKNGDRPLRCDCRTLLNDKGTALGSLYVFTDISLETDILTGFHNWESFKRMANETPDDFGNITAAVCDINSLRLLNATYGRDVGDKKLSELAQVMRSVFPKDCYFVRGSEAALIALIPGSDESAASRYTDKVIDEYDTGIQTGVSSTASTGQNVVETIITAMHSMQAKKLLDANSGSSGEISSLVHALQECDRDTEAHVRRTQRTGRELGKRLNLSDLQQSNLSLLCILHDIGKIGIPLEILNKPGILSEAEWQTIRTHAQKGYQIAKSSKEISGIAEMILHHHERWDGKGYPDGLSCETIPLLSRVIAVVDAFDAMTNDRAYRRAMSVEAAVKELKRCAGVQFDPNIVSEFTQMISENPELIADVTGAKAENSQALNEMKPIGAYESEHRNSPGANTHPIAYTRFTLDAMMKIVSVDSQFEALTGYTQEDVAAGLTQMDLIPEEDREFYLHEVQLNLGESNLAYLEHRIRRKDGTDIYVYCLGRDYYDSAVRANRSEIIMADCSETYSVKTVISLEHRKSQARLENWEKAYRRDSLTGIMNHAAFQSSVEMQLLGEEKRILLIMLDIDRFKQLNDTFGHRTGDIALINLSKALEAAVGDDGFVCRLGGDEFSAAIPMSKDATRDEAESTARRIFDNISRIISSGEHPLSISMGAVLSKDGDTFNDLYDAADKALYKSKNEGRGRLTC